MSKPLHLDNIENEIEGKIIEGINEFELIYEENIIGEVVIGYDNYNPRLLEIRYVQINPNYRKQGLLRRLIEILLYNEYTLYGEVDEILDEVEGVNARQIWEKLGAVFEYEYTWVIVNDRNK